MSKFLLLGLTLPETVEKVTASPTSVLPLPEKLGTMKLGSIADLAVLAVREGRFTFTDNPKLRQKRVGRQRLVATATVKSGRLIRHRGT